MITVGLPVYASPIVWLAMESLCRQKTTCDWELIVYEDEDQAMGIEFYKQYSERLALVNCKAVIYKYSKDRLALSKKWCEMSNMAHEKSNGIILQAADCYSEPNRIQTAYDKMSAGYDWVHSASGIFMFIQTKQTIEFNKTRGTTTGLNMCMSKSLVQQIPPEDKWSGVDYWLITNLLKVKPNLKTYLCEDDDYLNGIDTDGFNRISMLRRDNYNNPIPPFFKTNIKASDCLPLEVYEKLITQK